MPLPPVSTPLTTLPTAAAAQATNAAKAPTLTAETFLQGSPEAQAQFIGALSSEEAQELLMKWSFQPADHAGSIAQLLQRLNDEPVLSWTYQRALALGWPEQLQAVDALMEQAGVGTVGTVAAMLGPRLQEHAPLRERLEAAAERALRSWEGRDLTAQEVAGLRWHARAAWLSASTLSPALQYLVNQHYVAQDIRHGHLDIIAQRDIDTAAESHFAIPMLGGQPGLRLTDMPGLYEVILHRDGDIQNDPNVKGGVLAWSGVRDYDTVGPARLTLTAPYALVVNNDTALSRLDLRSGASTPLLSLAPLAGPVWQECPLLVESSDDQRWLAIARLRDGPTGKVVSTVEIHQRSLEADAVHAPVATLSVQGAVKCLALARDGALLLRNVSARCDQLHRAPYDQPAEIIAWQHQEGGAFGLSADGRFRVGGPEAFDDDSASDAEDVDINEVTVQQAGRRWRLECPEPDLGEDDTAPAVMFVPLTDLVMVSYPGGVVAFFDLMEGDRQGLADGSGGTQVTQTLQSVHMLQYAQHLTADYVATAPVYDPARGLLLYSVFKNYVTEHCLGSVAAAP